MIRSECGVQSSEFMHEGTSSPLFIPDEIEMKENTGDVFTRIAQGV